jgi:arginyl-tRNA synthetase
MMACVVWLLTADHGENRYAHVRLSSVERRAAPAIVLPAPSEILGSVNTSLLVESKARDITALLATYPDVVKAAIKSQEPSTIVTFCFKLTHAISSAWEVLIVRGQEAEVAKARLFLYVCARDVLASAMRLLTLTPLDRM